MTDKNQTASLLKQLDQIGNQIKSQILLKGILELTAVILTGIMVLFVLDVLAHFPYVVRLLILFGGLGYVGYRFANGALKRYKQELTPEQVSLMVEKEFPQFRSRMISTLQFDKAPPKSNMSLELIGGMVSQTFSLLKNVTLTKVIDRSWQKKSYLSLLAAVCVSVVLIASLPDSFKVYLKRLVLPVSYPTKTQVVKVELPTYLIAGESFHIKVLAKGVLPDLGSVSLSAGGDTLQADLQRVNEEGEYSCKLNGILEAGSLRVSLGDFETDSIAVNVVHRPRISKINLQVISPEYTGLKDVNQNSGNGQFIAGSKIRLEITPNKALQEVTLFNKSTEERLPEFTKSGEKWIAEFAPKRSLTYTFTMLDEQGLSSKDIPEFRLTVKEDRKPYIRLLKPTSLKELSPVSSIELEAKIRDDFSVAHVQVLYSVSDGEVDSQTDAEDFEVAFDYKNISKQEFVLKELFKNAKLNLEVGQLLKIRIEATDNSPQKNKTISEDILIPIISEAELRQRLSEELFRDLEPVYDLQNDLNESNRKTNSIGERE